MHDAPTPSEDAASDLAPWEIELSVAIVARFVSTRPWLREELDDLAQECLIHWLRQRGRYESARGASIATFMRRVIGRHLLDLETRRSAQKRGEGQPSDSFDAEGDEGLSLYDTTASNQDTAAAAVFGLGLTRALSRLTPEQRALADALISGHQMASIARAANRARSSLYRDLARIQEVFKDEGLDEFL